MTQPHEHGHGSGHGQGHGHPGGAGANVPRLIAWEVTRTCPMNCQHCRAAARHEAYAGELSTQECFQLLDNIASFAKPIIILTGGEPMTRPDIYDIAAHGVKLGLPMVMAPCGLLLNDESAARIVQSGIRLISISLDGATAKTHDAFRAYPGSFDACLAGIAAAKRAGLAFQINTTVSKHNVEELPAILDLALRLGAKVFNPFLLVPTGRGKELLAQELSPQEYEQTLQWLAGQQGRKDIPIRVTCAPHYQRILRQGGCLRGEGVSPLRPAGNLPAIASVSSSPASQTRWEPQEPTEIQECQGHDLPHWTKEGASYAVTFRLSDSLPPHILQGWMQERDSILQRAKQQGRALTAHEERELDRLYSTRIEVFLDSGHGACHLSKPEIAPLVLEALRHFDAQRYDLIAWCIMPNHVHVIVRPLASNDLADILHSWKSFTAKQANKSLGKTGAFWQEEYYDHLIRDEEDFNHHLNYLLQNPERAGLKGWQWVGTQKKKQKETRGQDARGTQGQDALATGAPPPQGCIGGKAFAFISHVGKVQICGFLDVECGDLRKEGLDFRKVWETSEVFRRIRDVDSYSGRCGYCEYRRVCSGCRARAYALSGDYLGEEPYCTYQPARKRDAEIRDATLEIGDATLFPAAGNGVVSLISEMDELDKRILEAIQTGFPIARRPYDVLGKRLGTTGDEVFRRVARLTEAGCIRRLGAVFDSQRLGYTSTLVAAKVPPDRLDEVVGLVNQIPGVTHNYRRDHAYNLWFTLTAGSQAQLTATISRLKRDTGIDDFHSLPALAVYKSNVQFWLGEEPPPSAPPQAPRASRPAVTLDDRQRQIVRALQESLPMVEEPFEAVAGQLGRPLQSVLDQANEWIASGVIRRVGAVLAHRRIQFTANGMAVFAVPPERIDEVGLRMARESRISHCYRRPELADWPYNLFAMVHGRAEAQVREFVEGLAGELGLERYDILFSTQEYKKESMRFFVEVP
jgi:radical SAM protein with 4Fe4S-binding SPASM domain